MYMMAAIYMSKYWFHKNDRYSWYCVYIRTVHLLPATELQFLKYGAIFWFS